MEPVWHRGPYLHTVQPPAPGSYSAVQDPVWRYDREVPPGSRILPHGTEAGYGPRSKTCFPWLTGPRCPGVRDIVFSVVAAPQVLPAARSYRVYARRDPEDGSWAGGNVEGVDREEMGDEQQHPDQDEQEPR